MSVCVLCTIGSCVCLRVCECMYVYMYTLSRHCHCHLCIYVFTSSFIYSVRAARLLQASGANDTAMLARSCG